MKETSIGRYLFLLVAHLFLVNSTYAAEKTEEIRLAVPDGTMVDYLKVIRPSVFYIEIFKKKYPNYHVDVFEANVQRILFQLKNSNNTCFMESLEDRSRLAYMYWTPTIVGAAPVLVMRKEAYEKAKIRGNSVSLKSILKNDQLRGAVAHERSFGPQIDKILASTKKSNMQRETFAFYSQNIMEMIAQGRIDYTIEHKIIFDKVRSDKNHFVILTMSDAGQLITSFFGCSRSPLGKEVVLKMDEVIRQNIQTPEYEAILQAGWSLDPPSKDIQKATRAFMKARAKTVMIE